MSLNVAPDSEIVAPVSIRSLTGIPRGRCSMIESHLTITENYGLLVGRTLVNTSNWSAEVLVINPGSDVIVLPPFSCVGAGVCGYCCEDTVDSTGGYTASGSPHLEEIVAGSLGVDGCAALTHIFQKYNHVFLALGDPVPPVILRWSGMKLRLTAPGPSVVGHVALPRQGSEQKQVCVRDMVEGGQIEPSDSPWASPVVLVTKKTVPFVFVSTTTGLT